MYILVLTRVLIRSLCCTFILDFVKHQKKKKKMDFKVWPGLLTYPWYLTRKVFNLEKLNLFEIKAQNLKGLF